jgi:transcriptional regulator with XRE-family HTH domain
VSGAELKAARTRLRWTQQRAAREWKVSQPYLSLMEQDKRPVSARLARVLVGTEPQLATGLPLEELAVTSGELPRFLGSLGYEGFAYLADRSTLSNPASVLLAALRQTDVSARVTEALPWLLVTFASLNWD